jgi:predicted ATP-grasp superfamily ATP-dependent carboligase
MKILVLNCFSRNALAVINSLDPTYELIGASEEKKGYRGLTPDRWFKSKRLEKVVRHRDPLDDPNGFCQDIITTCRENRIDAVIPTGTVASNTLSMVKTQLEKEADVNVLVEEYEKLIQVADKWGCYQICRRLGIPAPRTVLLDGENDQEGELDKFEFPVVIKPRNEYASKGLRFAEDRWALDRLRNEMVAEQEEKDLIQSQYIIQEAIRGELHDVTSCSRNGEVVSILSQQRMMTLYDFGGGGIVNKTTREIEIIEYARRLIRGTEWNGILELDFIRTDPGKFYLLECNPKIWGTTQLTVDAGLNVVQELVDLFVLKKQPIPEKPYEVGLLYKWIFPECLYHWMTAPRSLSDVLRRVKNTFKRYGAKRSITNIQVRNLRHLLGILLNKSER